jgi:hypothetical protein
VHRSPRPRLCFASFLPSFLPSVRPSVRPSFLPHLVDEAREALVVLLRVEVVESVAPVVVLVERQPVRWIPISWLMGELGGWFVGWFL